VLLLNLTVEDEIESERAFPLKIKFPKNRDREKNGCLPITPKKLPNLKILEK
jgi:hypothetical protein